MKKNSSWLPDAASGQQSPPDADEEIADKKAYARRWRFSVRTIDNLIRAGLPCLRIGTRRVRILVPEADAWMRERFGVQGRGQARPHVTSTKTPEGVAP